MGWLIRNWCELDHARLAPSQLQRLGDSRQNCLPELRAPMTREIELQLEQLVAKFGEKEVLEALDPLVTKCKWNDWQCVANAIQRIARKRNRAGF